MPMTKKRPIQKAPPADRSLTFSYVEFENLGRYVTEQGSILQRVRTGLAQKQQRRLARAIKHARHLALMPFTQTL